MTDPRVLILTQEPNSGTLTFAQVSEATFGFATMQIPARNHRLLWKVGKLYSVKVGFIFHALRSKETSETAPETT